MKPVVGGSSFPVWSHELRERTVINAKHPNLVLQIKHQDKTLNSTIYMHVLKCSVKTFTVALHSFDNREYLQHICFISDALVVY